MARMRYGIVSIIGHVVVIALCLSYASIRGCQLKRQPIEIKEMTIAIAPVEEDPAPVEEKKMAETPPPPPPKKDDVVIPKDKPKPPEPKKVEPKKTEPKKPDPPKKDKTKIVKGKRVTQQPVKSDKPVVKPASEEEIKKFLANRNKIKLGTETSLPANELSEYLSILNKALSDSWNQPSREAAGTGSASVTFKIDATGRISDPRITVSSGSEVFDNSVCEAVRRVGYVRGLSPEFIREWGKGVSAIKFNLL